MGQGHARRLWTALLALAIALCVPVAAQASPASERRAAERSLAKARAAVSAQLAREIQRATPVAQPPAAWIVAPASAPAVAAAPPEALEPPYVERGLHMGGTARCTRGYWDDTPEAPYAITYRWYRDGAAIAGATSEQLPIERSDIGKEIACAAIADAQTESRSQPQEVRPPELWNSARVIGLPYPGRELLCPRGEWNDSPEARYAITYGWLRNGEPMPGYGEVYTITAEDIGDSFSCELTAEGEWKDQTRSAYASWEPVQTRIVALDDAVAPSADTGYRVTFSNRNPVDATLASMNVILPDGFRYRPQTTTGVLTSEPAIFGEHITWNAGGLRVPAGATLSFSFGVRASAEIGHHFVRTNISGGGSNLYFDAPWEAARVTIEAPFDLATCTINGTAGDDVLAGTPGDDVICGGGGDDVLRGGEGDDVLFGGAGSDRLDGGEGDDTLLGGAGEDILLTGPGADLMRGGGGLDSVSYASRRDPVHVSLGDDNPDGAFGEGDDVDGDIEIVRGGRSDDELFGTNGDEEFSGGAGNDRIWSDGGADLIEAGDGDDEVESGYYDAADRVFCGSGYDSYGVGDEDRVSACEYMITRPELARTP